MTDATDGTPARARRRVDDRNVVLIVLGTVLVVLSLRGLLWYSTDGGNNVAGSGFTFADLRVNAEALGAPVATAYFDWLAWTALVAAAVLALGANLAPRFSDPLRVGAFLTAVVGLVATYYALAQLFSAQRAAGGTSHPVWHNASLGVWAILLGFAMLLVGGVLGGRRTGATPRGG